MALNCTKRIEQIKKVIDPVNLTNAAYPVFVNNTPVKSGNARNRTTKQQSSITADYAYAKRLDNGWSKQSPKGMVGPTVDYIRAYIKRQLGI